jgi:hypothetical protein
MAYSIIIPRKQFFDNNGSPLVGGQLFTYYAGTSTPYTTWQDSSLSVLNANPIVLDSRGECKLYGDGTSLKLELRDAMNVVVWTEDNVTALPEDVDSGNTPSTVVSSRNYIINGSFDVWQRGTALNGAGYLADRWSLTPGTGSTMSTSRNTIPMGDTYFTTATYTGRLVRTATGSGDAVYFQRIENVRLLANQQVTLSFKARGSALLTGVQASFTQSFGTGGSPSADVLGTAVTLSPITTAGTNQSVTFNIPSVSGKTLGTNGNDYLQINIIVPPSVGNFTSLDITDVQVETGNTATAYKKRDIAQEVMFCQRYFQKSYSLDVQPTTITTIGQIAYVGGAARATVFLRTEMRVFPTVTLYSPNNGATGAGYNGAVASNVAMNATDVSTNNVLIANNGTNSAGQTIAFHYTANSEL